VQSASFSAPRRRLEFALSALWAAIGIAFVAVYAAARTPQVDSPYCAGFVLDAGGDPYRAIPLGMCETRFFGAIIHPSPFAPYVLAFFRILAWLPYDAAALTWLALIVAATVITVVTVVRITGVPLAAACAGILPIALRDTIPLGQPFPIELCALALAARSLQLRRYRAATLALTVTMIEPNIGLAACISAALVYRPLRVGLIAAAAVVLVIDVVAAPPALTIEYLSAVLPAQAASELQWIMQYSLAHVLAIGGVPARVALFVGSLSFVVAATAGIILAGRLAQRDAAYVVVVPPAVSLVGGTYVHVWQLSAAMLLALLVVSRTTGTTRACALGATLLLCVPWIEIGFPATGFVAVPAVFTLVALLGSSFVAALALGAAVAAASAGIGGVQPVLLPVGAQQAALAPGDLAEVPWSRYVDAANPRAQLPIAVALDVPTWIGLGLAIAATVRIRGRRDAR
jgi:hypothetical protein